MSSEQPVPCQFCRSPTRVRELYDQEYGHLGYVVECIAGCQVNVPAAHPESAAVNVWNRRM